MRAWRGHVLPWEQPASDVTGVREAEEMAHDDASAGLHFSACITTLICKCNELTMTRTTKWMYIYMYIISCVMHVYFLSLICEIWMWFEFEFEFICLMYFIWIYIYACFIFLIQEIIYRGGQIIKPATANQHNHGGPQKVPAAVNLFIAAGDVTCPPW